MEAKHKKVLFCIFSILNKNMVHFYRVYGRMRQIACFFYISIFHYSVIIKLESMSQLVCWLIKQIIPNRYFRMFVKQYFMYGHVLALLNNQQVRIIDTFLPQRPKIVQISEKFELSDGFC